MKISGSQSIVIAAVLLTIFFAQNGIAQDKKKADPFPKDTRTYSQKEKDRNWSQAQKGHDRMQTEKASEAMRDKTHDQRLKVGKDTSVGTQTDPPGMNIRKSTP